MLTVFKSVEWSAVGNTFHFFEWVGHHSCALEECSEVSRFSWVLSTSEESVFSQRPGGLLPLVEVLKGVRIPERPSLSYLKKELEM